MLKNWLPCAAFIVIACDFPTALPIFEPRFLLPVDSAQMAVTQLTPPTVTVAGNTFAILLERARVSQGILDLCGDSCRTIQGITAPKPPFLSALAAALPLPEDVNSLSGASGAITVALTNNVTFDPIRPAKDVFGAITILLLADAIEVARDSILGSETEFAPGSTITRTLRISGLNTASPLTVQAIVNSPAGDAIRVNPSSSLDVLVTPDIRVDSLNVRVVGRPVRTQTIVTDLTELDDAIEGHIKRAAMKLTILNPFPVSGSMTATLTGSGVVVAPKPFNLVPGRSIQLLELTPKELESMLGKLVVTSVSGVVNAPGGRATVFPAQALSIAIELDMTLTNRD